METARFYELAGTGKLVRAIGRTKSARKVYTDKFLRDIYSRFIYKGIAPALASRGVISESSVRRIKAMPQNQGKKRGNWNATTMRGKKVKWWARSKVRPVCIKEVHFQFKARIWSSHSSLEIPKMIRQNCSKLGGADLTSRLPNARGSLQTGRNIIIAGMSQNS